MIKVIFSPNASSEGLYAFVDQCGGVYCLDSRNDESLPVGCTKDFFDKFFFSKEILIEFKRVNNINTISKIIKY